MQALNLRVLCIDDDAATLQSEADLLQSWGCQTMTADGWHTALQQVSQFQPHLLLVDYHLQQAQEDDITRRNGLELIGVMRKLLDREIPAVIVTGDRSDDIRASVLAAEVQYLNKPLRPMALRALLQQASHGSLSQRQYRKVRHGYSAPVDGYELVIGFQAIRVQARSYNPNSARCRSLLAGECLR